MRRDGSGGDTDASLANGTESAMAFSGWHARVFASMECRSGHAGQGFPADRVTPGLSMLTLRVSMAPIPIAGARLFGSREVESAHRLVDCAGLNKIPRLQATTSSTSGPVWHQAGLSSSWVVVMAGETQPHPGRSPGLACDCPFGAGFDVPLRHYQNRGYGKRSSAVES